jgi:hypothetical protein
VQLAREQRQALKAERLRQKDIAAVTGYAAGEP